jgi:tetratricopeptide (TPR) repeat protein
LVKNLKKNILFCLIILGLTLQSTFAMSQSEIASTLQAAFNANNQKQYSKSITLAEKVLKTNPKNYQALCILGMAYSGQGAKQKAIATFTQASVSSPNEWSADSFIADIYMQSGSYYIARRYYTKVLSNKNLSKEEITYFKKQIDICNQKLTTVNKNANVAISDVNVKIPYETGKWKMRALSNSTSGWSVEYGYMNENVAQDKWTKLITVNYFKTPKFKIDSYYNQTISLLRDFAVSQHKAFMTKLISKTPTEIIYEWNVGKGEEAEIARIIQKDNDIYHIHYAQKSNITTADRDKWIKILKASTIQSKVTQSKSASVKTTQSKTVQSKVSTSKTVQNKTLPSKTVQNKK